MNDMFIFGSGSGGGAGGGASLTINAVDSCTVTVSNASTGKSYTKAVTAGNNAVFYGLQTGTWDVTISGGSGEPLTQTINVVSDYDMTVAFFNATINVTYPEGATCTAYMGNTTLTAPDTSGVWACVVTAPGTWVIHCTNGTSEVSSEVTVSENGQTESVSLIFAFSAKTAGFTFTKSQGGDKGSYVDPISGWLAFKCEWTGNYDDYAWGVSDQTIDVTNYTKMTGTFKVSNASSAMTQAFVRFGIHSKNTGNISSSSYYQSNTKSNGTFVKEIDISAKTGNMYIYGGVYDNDGSYQVAFQDFVFS